MAEENQNNDENEFASLAEWIKFAILVVFIIATLLIISLLRPWIFGQVVPAVLGNGATNGEMIDPAPAENESEPPEPVDNQSEAPAEAYPGPEGDETSPATDEEEGSEPASPAAEEEITEPPSDPEPAQAETPSESEADLSDPASSPSAEEPAADAQPDETPSEDGITHVVLRGDTLYEIAQRYGVTVEEILEANPDVDDLNNIRVGQSLAIPTP
ncbi:MAG: LysM peptidoglycan-binding domain-containing protein [Ardenticatenaceae bacterium]|nr:LysM peptidoglycan-binding domain-containing protein [Ardenticatenaceae bacterium]